ncbi:MAG: hypothetical protein JWR67_1975 [Mucilaginibacter sp.]|nr:hypothetical protein [Mucilaginibacter sp.]
MQHIPGALTSFTIIALFIVYENLFQSIFLLALPGDASMIINGCRLIVHYEINFYQGKQNTTLSCVINL